jgi:hypothetical protein
MKAGGVTTVFLIIDMGPIIICMGGELSSGVVVFGLSFAEAGLITSAVMIGTTGKFFTLQCQTGIQKPSPPFSRVSYSG